MPTICQPSLYYNICIGHTHIDLIIDKKMYPTVLKSIFLRLQNFRYMYCRFDFAFHAIHRWNRNLTINTGRETSKHSVTWQWYSKSQFLSLPNKTPHPAAHAQPIYKQYDATKHIRGRLIPHIKTQFIRQRLSLLFQSPFIY